MEGYKGGNDCFGSGSFFGAVGFLAPGAGCLALVADPLLGAEAFLAQVVDLFLLCVLTMLKK